MFQILNRKMNTADNNGETQYGLCAHTAFSRDRYLSLENSLNTIETN